MNINKNFTEDVAALASVAPTSQAASTVVLGPVNSYLWRRLVAVLHLGALGSSATVDSVVKTSATSGGSYAALNPNVAITTVSAGAENVVFVEVKAETIQATGTGPWVEFTITVATAASITSAILYGVVPRYEPASDYNETNVTQILVA